MARPFDAEHLGKTLEVHRGRFSNAVDVVTKPRHAEVAQLLVEECNAELLGQERNVLDDRLSDAPLLVLSQFDNRREEAL